MKRGFLTILVLCAVTLFGGCREGGWSVTDGNASEFSESSVSPRSAQSAAELNVGVRSSVSVVSSSVSSSSTEQSAAQSSSESAASNESTSVSVTIVPQITEEPVASSSAESVPQSSAAVSASFSESAAPIIQQIISETSTAPEIPAESFVISSSESVPEPTVSTVSSPETSEVVSEPLPETSVSPYDYEGTVYIAASGNGKRYHKNPRCSRMNGSLPMTVDEALKKGYTPCKNCW